jgi:hypothetical protein
MHEVYGMYACVCVCVITQYDLSMKICMRCVWSVLLIDLYIPPGRDEYFLVNLGSMSAQESTHRACLHHKNFALQSAAKVFFPLWSKVLIPAGNECHICSV